MKKITKLFIIIFCLFISESHSQDGYTYTLQHNGGYSFTIQAVPNASTSNFATSVQSYGFTIIVPDGVTIDTGSATSVGGGESASFFDGDAIGEPTIDGYLVTETLSSPATLPAPSTNTNSNMYTFTVNGSPTSGEISILANNSSIATSISALKSFMQADMVDNGMAEFENVVDPNASGLSGMTSFIFSTFSIDDIEDPINNVIIYPIPADNVINIEGSIMFNSFSLYDILGNRILNDSLNINSSINVGSLSPGSYILKLNAGENYSVSKKFIKR